jgi:hypothetical protein
MKIWAILNSNSYNEDGSLEVCFDNQETAETVCKILNGVDQDIEPAQEWFYGTFHIKEFEVGSKRTDFSKIWKSSFSRMIKELEEAFVDEEEPPFPHPSLPQIRTLSEEDETWVNRLTDKRLKTFAEEDVVKLISLLEDFSLSSGDLTRAAMAARYVLDRDRIEPVLISLIRRHPSVLVREGCIYGLESRLSSSVKEVLNFIMINDSSPVLREIVKEMLEGE